MEAGVLIEGPLYMLLEEAKKEKWKRCFFRFTSNPQSSLQTLQYTMLPKKKKKWKVWEQQREDSGGTINLAKGYCITIINSDEADRFSFLLKTIEEEYILDADSEDSRQQWVDLLVLHCPVKSFNVTLLDSTPSSANEYVKDVIGKVLLQITSESVILTSKTVSNVVWRFGGIRRYKISNRTFTIETGRKSECGEGIFKFSCQEPNDIFKCLDEAVKERCRAHKSEEIAKQIAVSHNQKKVVIQQPPSQDLQNKLSEPPSRILTTDYDYINTNQIPNEFGVNHDEFYVDMSQGLTQKTPNNFSHQSNNLLTEDTEACYVSPAPIRKYFTDLIKKDSANSAVNIDQLNSSLASTSVMVYPNRYEEQNRGDLNHNAAGDVGSSLPYATHKHSETTNMSNKSQNEYSHLQLDKEPPTISYDADRSYDYLRHAGVVNSSKRDSSPTLQQTFDEYNHINDFPSNLKNTIGTDLLYDTPSDYQRLKSKYSNKYDHLTRDKAAKPSLVSTEYSHLIATPLDPDSNSTYDNLSHVSVPKEPHHGTICNQSDLYYDVPSNLKFSGCQNVNVELFDIKETNALPCAEYDHLRLNSSRPSGGITPSESSENSYSHLQHTHMNVDVDGEYNHVQRELNESYYNSPTKLSTSGVASDVAFCNKRDDDIECNYSDSDQYYNVPKELLQFKHNDDEAHSSSIDHEISQTYDNSKEVTKCKIPRPQAPSPKINPKPFPRPKPNADVILTLKKRANTNERSEHPEISDAIYDTPVEKRSWSNESTYDYPSVQPSS